MFDFSKRMFIAWCCLLTLALPAKAANTQVALKRIDQYVSSHFRAYDDLREACARVGHRLTGSENGRRAERMAFNLLNAAGLDDLGFQPFNLQAWFREKVSLQVVDSPSGAGRQLPVVALSSSPEHAAVQAELVDVGNGLEADFNRVGKFLKGRLALAYLGILPGSGKVRNLHRTEKTAMAIRCGAVGIVFFNQVPGGVLLTGTASLSGSLIAIPAVCISHEDGLSLRKRLQSGESVRVKLAMRNHARPASARNVIATLKGRAPGNESIIIGAHLDSWDLACGAIDNGIGAFAVIGVARTLAAIRPRPKRTVKFVLFMGEEQGILGSHAFVKEALKSGDLRGVRLMMNLDMTANPVGFRGEEAAAPGLKALGDAIRMVVPDFPNQFRAGVGLHGDGRYFLLRGIPVISPMGRLDKAVYRYYHSNRDTFDLVNRDHLFQSVRITAMAVYALADAESLPLPVRTDDEVRRFLMEKGFRKELERTGEWRWPE